MSFSDALVTYKFIKWLTTDFTKWKAFKLGLIDKDGNTLRSAETREEEDAFPKWQKMLRKLKQLIGRISGGATKLGSFAAALWLLKEELGIKDISILEEAFVEHISLANVLLENDNNKKLNTIEKGRYEYQNKTIVLRENFNAIGECLGYPIFNVTDFVSGDTFTITEQDIRKF